MLFNYYHQDQLPRGNNLNPLVNGVRPDPSFANIISTVTDAEIIRHELYVNFNLSLVTPSPAVAKNTFNWRRLAMNGGYSFLRARRNAMGPFDVPAERVARHRVGPRPCGQSVPHQRHADEHPAQKRDDGPVGHRVGRLRLQLGDRIRRQRRRPAERSPRRRRHLDSAIVADVVDERPSHLQPPDPAWRARRPTEPPQRYRLQPVRQRQQPDQPRQPVGIQRRDDVAFLQGRQLASRIRASSTWG